MATRDPMRGWPAVLGSAAVGLALFAASAHAQPAKPPSTVGKPAASVKPLTESERKTAEELQAAQRQLDTDSARVMVGTPDGRRRVPEAIAKQFGVSDKVVTDLRARRLGYGEASVVLALSRQLMKRDRLSQTQALDRLLARRASGWAVVARDLGLTLTDVIAEVKKTDAQLPKLTVARATKPAPAR